MTKRTLKRIEARERMRKVVELHRDGWSFEDIAGELGYASSKTAYGAYRRCLDRMIDEPTEEVIALKRHRLNQWMRSLSARCNEGDTAAIQTALKVQSELDKLDGIDTPKKMQVEQVNTLTVGGNSEDYITALKNVVPIKKAE
jgi:hypothetical protein